MLKKDYIPGRDNCKLHREHVTVGGHPGCWNDLVPQGDNVLHSLTIHQMCSAFDFDDGFVSADSMVTVLEVEAKGQVGIMLEKDIADRTVDDVVNERSLYNCPGVSAVDRVSVDKYRPDGRYWPPQWRGDHCNGHGQRGRSW